MAGEEERGAVFFSSAAFLKARGRNELALVFFFFFPFALSLSLSLSLFLLSSSATLFPRPTPIFFLLLPPTPYPHAEYSRNQHQKIPPPKKKNRAPPPRDRRGALGLGDLVQRPRRLGAVARGPRLVARRGLRGGRDHLRQPARDVPQVGAGARGEPVPGEQGGLGRRRGERELWIFFSLFFVFSRGGGGGGGRRRGGWLHGERKKGGKNEREIEISPPPLSLFSFSLPNLELSSILSSKTQINKKIIRPGTTSGSRTPRSAPASRPWAPAPPCSAACGRATAWASTGPTARSG